MRSFFNPNVVWSQTLVADRTVEVNTKTGFSLTAGSYSVLASSTQTGSLALASVTSNTATISSVTTTRACLTPGQSETDAVTFPSAILRWVLTNATTVTVSRANGTGTPTVQYTVVELF